MKILFYLLTTIFGLFGILAVLRMIELVVLGAGLQPAQLLIAVVSLVLAVVFLNRARGKSSEKK